MGYHVQATDNTLIFKTCVKAIRTRNRACGFPEPDRPRTEQRQVGAFTLKSREVQHQIAKLGAFVLDTQAAYLNVYGLHPGAPLMSDVERDRIDVGVPRLAMAANSLLKELEIISGRLGVNGQHREHQKAVIQSLRDCLRYVTSIHSEMRASRVSKVKETKSTFRLDTRVKSETPAIVETEKPAITSWEPQEEGEEEPFSPEELQVFEEENKALQAELESVVEEIKELEGKVEDIAQLQGVFTEKILEQEVAIDAVSSAVIGTTENMKDANEQLRQAIQRNAGFRVYILFVLIVLSFTLLFLDWYNP